MKILALRCLPWLLMLVVVVGALYGCYCWGANDKKAEIVAKQTAADLAATQKVLSTFVAEAGRINGVAGRIEQQTADLSKQTSTHTVEYITHVKNVPMPVDCRPDAGRLQHIDSAVADANAAATGKPDASVPTH
jgi:hypothetical protein